MRSLVYTIVIGFVGVGVFAPILANDLPVIASVDGEWQFPAFHTYISDERPPTPGQGSWKQWWANLPEDSDDWALMPFIPYGPNETVRDHVNTAPHWESLGSHYLGNDDTGRDVLARLIHGASTALFIAIGVVLLAAAIGVPLGAVAGYWGGVPDVIVNSVVQLFLCFPPFFFVLAVMAFLGNSLSGVVIVLGLLYWVSFARIVRGEFLSLREREYAKCARGLGIGPIRVILRHLLPAARGPILVNAAFVAASAILVESTLSFLGLGPGLATVSWGKILMQGKKYAHDGAWHLWLFPSIALIATVYGLHSWADLVRRAPARR